MVQGCCDSHARHWHWGPPQNRPKKAKFAYFLLFFGPGTSARGFSRPWHRISRQKCRIWMRICRVTTISVVFEKFALVLKLNFQAVIKSAASAASPTAWELHGSARTSASAGGRRLRGAPMQLPSRRGGCASSRLDHDLKVF